MRTETANKKISPAGTVFLILRLLAALAAGFLLYTFLFTISLDQINHGNVIGSIFCIAVILLAVFYPLLKKRRGLYIAGSALAVALAVFAGHCAVISAFIASEMIHGESEAIAVSAADGGTAQTVIVLGCKTLNGEPSPMLELRLQKALWYLETHPGAVCICTGGQGGDEIEPEAVSMRRYLISRGIADERIFTEERSVNTTQNIKFAAGIIARENLPTKTVIVSECYHIYRGVQQAKLAGLDASGIYPDPSPVLITMPSYWLREIFAVTRDIVFGVFT